MDLGWILRNPACSNVVITQRIVGIVTAMRGSPIASSRPPQYTSAKPVRIFLTIDHDVGPKAAHVQVGGGIAAPSLRNDRCQQMQREGVEKGPERGRELEDLPRETGKIMHLLIGQPSHDFAQLDAHVRIVAVAATKVATLRRPLRPDRHRTSKQFREQVVGLWIRSELASAFGKPQTRRGYCALRWFLDLADSAFRQRGHFLGAAHLTRLLVSRRPAAVSRNSTRRQQRCPEPPIDFIG